jgi:hypothetical protein
MPRICLLIGLLYETCDLETQHLAVLLCQFALSISASEVRLWRAITEIILELLSRIITSLVPMWAVTRDHEANDLSGLLTTTRV